jgi:hypothetical protein
MPKRKGPHHTGSYDRKAKAVRDAANADASTRCWQCQRTRAEHGRAWTAGHERDGDPTSRLLPECAGCNYSRGARAGNLNRKLGVLRPTRQW